MPISPEQWSLLSGLLDEALDTPAEQRVAWLDSLRPRYKQLKEQLRTLLRCHTEAERTDFLGGSCVIYLLPALEAIASQQPAAQS